MPPASVFLTAAWRHLAMLNYEVDPAILVPLVPAGTELDAWQGRTFVSVVGFMFLDTRLFGMPIPLHRNFEEVNLRFYVRRKAEDGWRRGVVFVKELVPRCAVAWVARTVYSENYEAVPMSHRIELQSGTVPNTRGVSYSRRFRGQPQRASVLVEGECRPAAEGSEEEFITEHYWGYSRQPHGGTLEYRVEHPRWCIWPAKQAEFECDVAGLYGDVFRPFLSVSPASALLADGSPVRVHRGVRIVVAKRPPP